MLTKDDLKAIQKIIDSSIQKQTRVIVREEVENEMQAVKNELSSDIRMSRMRVQTDIQELKDRIKNSEIRLTKLDENVTKVDKKIAKMHRELKKEIKNGFNFLDKDIVRTNRRMTRVESHLHLPPLE